MLIVIKSTNCFIVLLLLLHVAQQQYFCYNCNVQILCKYVIVYCVSVF